MKYIILKYKCAYLPILDIKTNRKSVDRFSVNKYICT